MKVSVDSKVTQLIKCSHTTILISLKANWPFFFISLFSLSTFSLSDSARQIF